MLGCGVVVTLAVEIPTPLPRCSRGPLPLAAGRLGAVDPGPYAEPFLGRVSGGTALGEDRAGSAESSSQGAFVAVVAGPRPGPVCARRARSVGEQPGKREGESVVRTGGVGHEARPGEGAEMPKTESRERSRFRRSEACE